MHDTHRPALILALLLATTACSQSDGPEGLVGTLERDRIPLRLENDEIIVSRDAAEGEPVVAGALLLSQDPRRLEAALAAAEANLRLAQARQAELERGPRSEQIQEGRARLTGAEQDLAAAVTDLTRARELVDQHLASQQTFDNAKRARDLAEARRDEAKAALSALLAGTTVEELQQTAAAVAAAEATVTGRRLDLEQTRLIAANDGILERWLVEVGERPVPGQPVGVLLGADPYALTWLPEPYRSRVAVGDRVEVHVDGVTAPVTGTVRMIATQASFTPYYSLTERDRPRLAFRMEVALPDTGLLGTGTGVRVILPEGP